MIPCEHGDLTVRLITLNLKHPTRHGEWEITIASNLPKKVAARRFAQLYRDRWTIEVAFHQVAMSLHGEIDALAYPKAALFGFCIALVAHNLLNVVKIAIAFAQDGHENDLSTYYLAHEIAAAYYGMMIVLPPAFWRSRYRNLAPSELAGHLLDLAKQVPWKRFKKSTRGPKKPPPDGGTKTNRNHVSTNKLRHRP